LSNTIFPRHAGTGRRSRGPAPWRTVSPLGVFRGDSLAANQLILRDNGRAPKKPRQADRQIHGDSIGVHGCDSATPGATSPRCNHATRSLPHPRRLAGRFRSRRSRRQLPPGMFRARTPSVQDVAATPCCRPGGSDPWPRPGARRRRRAPLWRTGASRSAHWDMLLRYSIMVDGALHAEKFYAPRARSLRHASRFPLGSRSRWPASSPAPMAACRRATRGERLGVLVCSRPMFFVSVRYIRQD